MTRFSPSGVCSWARVSPGGLGRPTRLCNERLHFEGKWGRSFTDERETAQKLKGVATRGALPRFRLREAYGATGSEADGERGDIARNGPVSTCALGLSKS
jgi:hypothetical protein